MWVVVGTGVGSGENCCEECWGVVWGMVGTDVKTVGVWWAGEWSVVGGWRIFRFVYIIRRLYFIISSLLLNVPFIKFIPSNE